MAAVFLEGCTQVAVLLWVALWEWGLRVAAVFLERYTEVGVLLVLWCVALWSHLRG